MGGIFHLEYTPQGQYGASVFDDYIGNYTPFVGTVAAMFQREESLVCFEHRDLELVLDPFELIKSLRLVT